MACGKHIPPILIISYDGYDTGTYQPDMFQRFVFSEPNYNASGQVLAKTPVILSETKLGFFGTFMITNFIQAEGYGTPRTGIETKPVSVSVSVFMSY